MIDVASKPAAFAMHRFFGPVVTGVIALVLAACGGGGGGGSGSVSLSLSPSSVLVEAPPGLPVGFTVDGTINGDIAGGVFVLVVDDVGVIQTNVGIEQISSKTYRATFAVSTTLAPGTYTGSLSVQLCGSASLSCSPQYARTSLPYEFRIGADPNPVIGSLSANELAAGSPAFQMTVAGSNFWPSSVITWNGIPRATTFVSTESLRTQVTAAELVDGGFYEVRVSTPDGGTSEALPFLVVNPAPELRALGPTISSAGCGDFELSVLGSAFRPSSEVYWNDQALHTTYLSASALLATVPGAVVAEPGSALLTVRTPTPGGGSTLARSFTVEEAVEQSSAAVSFRLDPANSGAATVRCPTSVAAGPAWSVYLGGAASYALAADGRVFATAATGDSSSLVGLDQQTGEVIWGPVTVGRAASAAYDGGKVFVTTERDPVLLYAALQAYDAATGELLWRRSLAETPLSSVSLPSAAGGRVFLNYFDLIDSAIVTRYGAWAQADGAELWQSPAPVWGRSPPAVGTAGVYAGRACATYAYAPETGASLWSQEPACNAGAAGTTTIVTVDDGRVYSGAPSLGNGTPIYGEATGAPLGVYLGGREITVSGGVGYVVSGQAGITAFDLVSGAVQWQGPSGSVFGSSVMPPVVAGGVAWMVFSPGTVWGLDPASGERLWELPLPGLVTESRPNGGQWTGLTVGDDLLLIPAGNWLVAYRVGNP